MDDLDQLQDAEYNPRRISAFDYANLKKSIKNLGDLSGLVFNRRSGHIVGGHQRRQAYKELGGSITIEEELDTPNSVGTVARGFVTIGDEKYTYRVVDWPDDREKLANLAANRIQGEWDDDKLAELIYSLRDEEWLPDTGFNEGDITSILATVMDVGEDNADLTPPETPTARLGDLYQLGKHRVMCGDSTNAEHMELLMGGETAEMVFTDPPYNVEYQGSAGQEAAGKKRTRIMNDKLEADAFYQFLLAVCTNLVSHTKGSFYICMSSSELHSLHKAFTEAGGHWQSYVIWAKQHFVMGRRDYQSQYEPVMYGLTEEEAKRFDDPEAQVDSLPILYGYNKHTWFGGRKQGDVWMIERPSVSPHHPTEKPVTLPARAIRNSSHRGGIVLDTFGGSGTTVIAAEKLDRRAFVMELEPKYVDVIIRRWEHLTGEKAKKLRAEADDPTDQHMLESNHE